MTDREKVIAQARTYIGKNGNYVCNTKLHLGWVPDWCAYSQSSIFQDCGFIGKYIKEVTGGAGDIPRYSDGKFGTWFRKGTKTPQSGDLFFLRYGGSYNDKYHSDHVGMVESVSGDTLTTLEGNVDATDSNNWQTTSTFKRKTRYISDSVVYAFYRPNWNEKTTNKPMQSTNNVNYPNVWYRVRTRESGWLPEVKNLEDYAGIDRQAITDVTVQVSKGSVKYRVHVRGGNWLPYVTGCNINDSNNGYAGNGKPIDAIEIYYNTPSDVVNKYGYLKAKYRVTPFYHGYYDWQYDNEKSKNQDGYAGSFGQYLDRLQITLAK